MRQVDCVGRHARSSLLECHMETNPPDCDEPTMEAFDMGPNAWGKNRTDAGGVRSYNRGRKRNSLWKVFRDTKQKEMADGSQATFGMTEPEADLPVGNPNKDGPRPHECLGAMPGAGPPSHCGPTPKSTP